jgi:hypothetical protein
VRVLATIVKLGTVLATLAALSCRGNPGGRGDGAETAARETMDILEATKVPGTLIGVQYETFFTPHNVGSWDTAEAIPILGKYSSYDVKVMRKHEEWFEYLGVDWLLLDWSNMLWTEPKWEEHTAATKELEDTTDLLFKTYSQLEKEGRHPPRLVIMLGLQNGPPVPKGSERLNGIIDWTTKNFLDKPEYKNLWLYYHGRPLLTILFNVGLSCEDISKQTSSVRAPDWTVRWMGSQLQTTGVEKCGFWSWMDGTIRQVVTHTEGMAEEVVVTPSCFPPPKLWLDAHTVGRDHGTPYIESWKVAFESQPKFIQIHQWNEFAGQKQGEGYGPEHDIYGDEYNLELSDDLEPVQMDKCAYRGCGGWGYYYLNLTKALISLYRKQTPDITIMALSGPFQSAVIKQNRLPLSWKVLGPPPSGYTLELDGKRVVENIRGEKYTLELARVPAGKHRVTLVANGVHTYFDLAPDKMTEKSQTPMPVSSTIDFMYSPVSR